MRAEFAARRPRSIPGAISPSGCSPAANWQQSARISSKTLPFPRAGAALPRTGSRVRAYRARRCHFPERVQPCRELAAECAHIEQDAAISPSGCSPAANWQQSARISSKTLPFPRAGAALPRTGSRVRAYRARRCHFPERVQPCRELAAECAHIEQDAAISPSGCSPAANWQQSARISSKTLPFPRAGAALPRTGSRVRAYRARRCHFPERVQPCRELAAECAHTEQDAAISPSGCSPAANWQQSARIPSKTLPFPRAGAALPRTGSRVRAYRARRCHFPERVQPCRELAAECAHTEQDAAISPSGCSPAANWQQSARIPSKTLGPSGRCAQ